jgi:diacylglycerol O-acyltransferase / wax synthase
MQQLTGLDASFVYFETPNAPMHVASLSIYDPSTAPGGAVTFKGILDNIERRLHLSRVFRQKLVQVPMGFDHPYWVEDSNFDLEFHVRHIALPKPGDWRQLCIQVARLHSRGLDLNRPLWEVYVIEGLDNVEGVPPGSYALLQKTHHAAVDGVSGMEIMSALNDLTPEGEPAQDVGDWRPESDPDPWSLLARATVNNALRPMHFARVLGRTLPVLGRMQARLRRNELTPPPTGVPRTRFNGNVSAHRVVDACFFPLAEMRAVKAAVPGATINDAVLATVGGALRRYLAAKGELPDAPMVAMAPISVRSEDQMRAAGNQVSGMLVLLGTHIADPRERLAAVQKSTHEQKQFSSALGAHTLTDYSQFLPGGLAALASRTAARFEMANRADPMINTTVTNVPGPQVPLYSNGAKMVRLTGLGPIGDGMGLIHPIVSYCGQLAISFTACREMLPDPAFYADCIRQSFDELALATR